MCVRPPWPTAPIHMALIVGADVAPILTLRLMCCPKRQRRRPSQTAPRTNPHRVRISPTQSETRNQRFVTFGLLGLEIVEHGAALFSRQYGQSTAVVVFDRVFVPWERVFYAGEWEHSGQLTYDYATHHRARLAPTGQSVTLAQGTLGWRRLPERIEIADEKAVLARVQALGLTAFYSTKVSLSLSGLKKERDQAAAIAGVRFVPGGEDFWLKPAVSELELKPVSADGASDRR